MDIFEYYNKDSIAGVPCHLLSGILKGENKHIAAKNTNGRIILTPTDEEGKELMEKSFSTHIVKCIREYYQKPGEKFHAAASNNIYMLCDKVRNAFDIGFYAARGDCKSCHLQAMYLLAEGTLERKNKK